MTNSENIIDFDSEKEISVHEIGPKAARLIALNRAGFKVPKGFCITASAFNCFMDLNTIQNKTNKVLRKLTNFDDLLQNSLYLQNMIKSSEFPDNLKTEILLTFHALNSPSVAVRSSAIAEDTENASFAGQQESYLNINCDDDLLSAIRSVWASSWSERAIAYRNKLTGLTKSIPKISVIVQTMIEPKSSGVMFSIDPITGDTGQVVINSSWGLGTITVSGLQDPDTFIVEKKTGKILNTHIAVKSTSHVFNKTGIKEDNVGLRKARLSSLEDSTVKSLTQLAINIEKYFCAPQDIEWAINNSEIYILQSRPIVGMEWVFKENLLWNSPIENSHWSRVSFAEFIPNPSTDFFSTFLLPHIVGAYHQLHKKIWLDQFFKMPFLELINRYLYIRVDVKLNLKMFVGLVIKSIPNIYLALKSWDSQALPKLLAICNKYSASDIKHMDSVEIISSVDILCAATAEYWKTIALTTWAWKIIEGSFAFVYKLLLPNINISYDKLLTGLPSMVWQTERSLEKIADTYTDFSLHQRIERCVNENIDFSPENEDKQFLEDLKFHTDSYGFQTSDLDFVSPTIGERLSTQTQSLLRLWQSKDSLAGLRASSIEKQRLICEKEVLSYFVRFPLTRKIFSWLLKITQKSTQRREDINFFLTAAWPTIRLYAHELGQRLIIDKQLEFQEDIFYLTKNEIMNSIHHNKTDEPGLKNKVIQRKNLRERLMIVSAPQNIPQYKHKGLIARAFKKFYPEGGYQKNELNKLKGIPVCKGVVHGHACVVRSVDDFIKFKKGDVLITTTTSPVWTPLFFLASAIVTDVGGVLSHASIVAREFNITAVLGTHSATKRIIDGQTITVDGDRGIVFLQ